ncbi:17-beta-hydroxysteroid dehydrogenase 14 isoform X3 [Hemicordylus capensis]|uniref:17-beta-hydroxysteroid dehydrogenase 14 isoform X3 n=1 Tax=Hemicordylus capensis TaxID=884348 RepID=UPI00230437B4|nr:17-beta-hydroxysteroid dehydrogenase 14 isoform X3 [Hemicordylus capensis]
MLGGGGRRPHVAATLRPKISWIFGNLEELRQAEAGMASGLRYPGKVVIVTGGTRGIGEGIMREFVRQGAKVVFCAPESEGERGQALQRELKDSGSPGEGRFQVCDVLSEMDIKNLVSVTIEHYGRLDCLVNNAGWHPPEQQMDDVTAQEFRHLIDLNVVSCFLMAKYALPYLRKTKGNLINISSLVSIMGQKYAVPYVATKHLTWEYLDPYVGKSSKPYSQSRSNHPGRQKCSAFGTDGDPSRMCSCCFVPCFRCHLLHWYRPCAQWRS